MDAWNASVRTKGTAADRGRRVRWSVWRVGDNATKSGGGLWDGSLYRIQNCDIGVIFRCGWRVKEIERLLK